MRNYFFYVLIAVFVAVSGSAVSQGLTGANAYVRISPPSAVSEQVTPIPEWCLYALFAPGQVPEECGGGPLSRENVEVVFGLNSQTNAKDIQDLLNGGFLECTLSGCKPIQDCRADGCVIPDELFYRKGDLIYTVPTLSVPYLLSAQALGN